MLKIRDGLLNAETFETVFVSKIFILPHSPLVCPDSLNCCYKFFSVSFFCHFLAISTGLALILSSTLPAFHFSICPPNRFNLL